MFNFLAACSATTDDSISCRSSSMFKAFVVPKVESNVVVIGGFTRTSATPV